MKNWSVSDDLSPQRVSPIMHPLWVRTKRVDAICLTLLSFFLPWNAVSTFSCYSVTKICFKSHRTLFSGRFFFFQKLFVYKQFIRSLAKPVSVNFVQYYFWIFLGFHVIEILYQILTKSQCLSYEDLRVRSAH